MTPIALLQAVEQAGAVLTPQPDGGLRCKAPKGVLTHVQRADLRQHKTALVALLEEREERLAMAEEVPMPPPVPVPVPPCGVHDPIFFERHRDGWHCVKCSVLLPTTKEHAA